MVETIVTPPDLGDGGGDGAGSEPTPEQTAKLAADLKLANEAGKWRKQAREAEAKANAIQAERDALQKQIEDGNATDLNSKSEAARLTRELAELRSKDKARDERERALEAKTKTNAIKSRLAEIAAEERLLEPAAAMALLASHAEVDDDDSVVFRVKDKDTNEITKVEANNANIAKYGLLPGIFRPAVGTPGTGSRGVTIPGGAKLVGGIDMERAKTDTGYYRENRDKIMEIRRNVQK